MGCIGLALADFCHLTPDEFQAVYQAWADRTERQEQTAWERMRMQAAITIQPHVRGRVTPQRLLPLPWETQQKKKPRRKATTAAEDLKRFEEVLRKRQT